LEKNYPNLKAYYEGFWKEPIIGPSMVQYNETFDTLPEEAKEFPKTF
jgi:hypothetical protein